jgi:hypothetical protein
MAARKDGGGTNDAVRKSYQNLGTFRTAQNLIKHRGWMGLYSGFHLHLRMWREVNPWVYLVLMMSSSRYYRHWDLLCDVREREAAFGERPRKFPDKPAGCRSRWRHVRACELGLCTLPEAISKLHLLMLNTDLPD